MHVQVELHKAKKKKKITYHEQGAAPAPSVSDIHPISHEAFAKRQHKILELITRGKQNNTTYRQEIHHPHVQPLKAIKLNHLSPHHRCTKQKNKIIIILKIRCQFRSVLEQVTNMPRG